MMIVAATIGL